MLLRFCGAWVNSNILVDSKIENGYMLTVNHLFRSTLVKLFAMKNALLKLFHALSAPARGALALFNKYDENANFTAMAVLTAGVIAMFCGLIASLIYPGNEAHSEEAKRGYVIAGHEAFEAGAAGGAAEAKDEGPVDIAVYLQTADVAAGEKLIKRCTACHTFDKGGKNGVGPNNYGVLGAKIAHIDSFSYSDALKSLHSETWTFQNLSQFLENPKAFAPGNKMAFAGLRSPQDRANLLAYLNTLGSNLPYPAPKPVEKVEDSPASAAVTGDEASQGKKIPGNAQQVGKEEIELLKETDIKAPKNMQKDFDAQEKPKIKEAAEDKEVGAE